MVIRIPRWVLPRSVSAITLYPFIFVRKDVELTERLLNHERIHIHQQRELLVLPFYILYLGEYLIRRFQFGDHRKAYRNISFEREAYTNDELPEYLATRKLWSSFNYY